MLFSTLLIATSAIAGASAQLLSNGTMYSTPIACCSLQASQIASDRREAICEGQQNTCRELCGGEANVQRNTCDDTSLSYNCACSNGSQLATKELAPYQQSVPAQICFDWYGACISATGTSSAQQFQCAKARDEQCGNQTTGGAQTSGSASPSSASATRTGGSPAGTATPSPSAPAGNSGAGVATYGTSILAAGLMAVFGLVL